MTLEEFDIRHWLNRAFYADKKAKALDMLVRQCRERAEGLTRGSEGNDKGKSDGAENGTENALMKLAEMEEQAEQLRVEAVATTAEVWELIRKLNDDDLETVLIYRYILFYTIEKTAEVMNYHPNTVKIKVKKAMQKLCTEMS